MTAGMSIKPIPEAELAEDFFTSLHIAHQSMREAFSRSGLSQDEVAALLAVDKALISRRLSGKDNLTYRTMSYMASAMKCRLVTFFRPFSELSGPGNYYWGATHLDRPVTKATNFVSVTGTSAIATAGGTL